MATAIKKKTKGKAIVEANNSRIDYTNVPYFVKKREEAIKLIQRVGFPDSFIRKKSN